MRRTSLHRTLLAAVLMTILAAPTVFAADESPRHRPMNPITRFLVWIFDGMSSPPG